MAGGRRSIRLRWQTWRGWANRLKREVRVLHIAYRDPRTPWYARLLAVCLVAYAVSPFDLVPDFIPVLGYLDDLLLLPLGIALAVRLIPPAVLADARRTAHAAAPRPNRLGWLAASFVIVLWCAAVLSIVAWLSGWC